MMTDYKNTLNLPNTRFSMRGNLVRREPVILKRWHEQNLYAIIRRAKKGKKIFILHDGPPYANGTIHIGHSINKILKDIIIKSKSLMGYDSPYIPGWDCHGLPIELNVEQIISRSGKKFSTAEFRAACRRYASEQIEEQKKDFIRLGIIGDWENFYSTMNFSTEANTIRSLGKIIANGHLYKGIKPVHWCINCQSALAEFEVEYYNRTSSSVDVTFVAKNVHSIMAKFNVMDFIGSISIIIWTTTPWTLPANRAIAVHPDFDYQLIEINGKGYILAADLVKIVMVRIGIVRWKVLGSAKGRVMEQLQFYHPFMKFSVPIILSQHVTLDMGTGLVHIAPSHGPDDYILGQRYSLEVANLIGPDGCYLSGTFPVLDGLQVFKANDIIINLMNDSGTLLHMEKLHHNYPHCWRHKTMTIFRATTQWFINMNQHSLRKQALAALKDIQWIPAWSQACMKTMITTRPDWCVSRQRTWGVPMALFVHNDTEELHPRTIDLVEEIAKRVEKEGIQAWWDVNLNEILGADAAYYHKVEDTLDVWFDSGSTHFSVIAMRSEIKDCHKVDMYLEGLDQHRGWFMSSLMISAAITNQAPCRQILTHGFAVDEKGRKMSKSAGNVIKPQKVVDKLGADVLRLWVASTDYTNAMAVSDKILKYSVDIYRRIRNTARFLLANLSDFNPERHSINSERMIVFDRWIVGRTKVTQKEIIAAYDSYNFHNVIQYMMRFCSVELGSFYLDIIKDRQYTTKANSIARRSCQTALYHIIEALVRWMAPIVSFTADEIWGFIPGKRAQYVFTEEWYDGLFELDDTQPLNDAYWKVLFQVRNETNKIIEQARLNKYIGNSLEAHVTLYAEPILAAQLRKIENELYFVLLTSSAVVANYSDANDSSIQCTEMKGLKISLLQANEKKCQRCWHHENDIGKHINYPDICGRCISNTIGSGEERRFV